MRSVAAKLRTQVWFYEMAGHLFTGLSLGSILVLVALALALGACQRNDQTTAPSFRGIDLIALGAALGHANYLYLLPALAVVVVTLVLRAYRWGMLFYPDRPPLLGKLFSALSIGYLISTILPARLGDVVRAALVGEGKGPRFAQALSTVVVERLLDMFSIIVVLLVRIVIQK